MSLPSFWRLLAILGILWLVAPLFQILPPMSHGHLHSGCIYVLIGFRTSEVGFRPILIKCDLLLKGLHMHPCMLSCFSSDQFSSVAQSCPTLYNPMDCSTPGLPVHHHLLEFTQTQIHQVGDAIQPSHPLDRKSTRLNSSHRRTSRMPSSA